VLCLHVADVYSNLDAVRFNIADNVITHIQEVMAWPRVQGNLMEIQ